MPKYIIKLSNRKQDYYLEWSSIVDAPTTYGMPLKEFKQFYKEEYGRASMRELSQRLERVEKTGCSALHKTLDDTLSNNRAGENEKRLTKKQIIKKYCLERPEK